MSQSIILLCRRTWSLSTIQRVAIDVGASFRGSVTIEDQVIQLASPDHSSWLTVEECFDREVIIEEYEREFELDAELKRLVRQLRFFAVDFNDFEYAQCLVRLASKAASSVGEQVWIDTDYGWIMSGDEYLRNSGNSFFLDWRHPV